MREPRARSSTSPDCASQPSLTVHMGIVTRLLPDFAHASITAVDDAGDLTTLAHVGEFARDLGELQHGSGEGPGIDALRTGGPVAAPDIGRDPRWVTYAPAAAALGLRSQLAVPLLFRERPVGALDLYSTTQDRITLAAPAVAEAVAVQIVEAMMGLREIEHLRRALDNRACIGQATGLVMGRLHVDADHAFEYLRRVSMQQNRKLAQVAEELVRTRELPSRRPD